MGKLRPQQPPPCSHRGEAVKVGPYTIYAGGMQYFKQGDADGFDLLIPLTWSAPFDFGKRYQVLAAPLVDYGGVPSGWSEFLDQVVVLLEEGTRMLVFCAGSHGRTGCLLGSLIALLETGEETPDPIAAVRARHCHHAVETLAQAEAIFKIRRETLPAHYVEEFTPRHQLTKEK